MLVKKLSLPARFQVGEATVEVSSGRGDRLRFVVLAPERIPVGRYAPAVRKMPVSKSDRVGRLLATLHAGDVLYIGDGQIILDRILSKEKTVLFFDFDSSVRFQFNEEANQL